MTIVYCLFGTYSTGGIERVTTLKMNYLAEHGYDVHLITTGHAGRPSYYPLDPRIHHVDLGICYDEPGTLSRFTVYRRNYRKYQRHERELRRLLFEIKPDITIASGWHEPKFLYRIKDGSKKIIEHHSFRNMNTAMYPIFLAQFDHLTPQIRFKYWLRTLWGKLMTYKQGLYDRKFDQLVVLSEEDRELCTHCPDAVCIHNPLTFIPKETSPLTDKVILSIGRLSVEKNFPELVEIWALIAKDYPDWKLRIVGEGYTTERILAVAQKHGIEGQVELCPFTKDIQRHYLSSSIYAMTSAFEGFGLVLVEAEALGVLTVAYACQCGPRDIIRDGVDGFLIQPGDREAFANKLRSLIEHEELRQEMGKKAKVNAERFALDRIMGEWEKLFQKLVQAK